MNSGLMRKSICELWRTTLFCGVALSVVEGVLAYVLPTFQKQFSAEILQIHFLQSMAKAMLGMDTGETLGPEAFASVAWAHPVVLALVWTHAIVCCTRVPAGEVDRGTIDVLLGLPVSRWQVLGSEMVVWLGSSLVLMTLVLAGNAIGLAIADVAMPPTATRRLIVLVNLSCLYLAVGGFAWLVSAMSDRRGRAITIVFAVVLASFLLNYLAQFWSIAQSVSFLSILVYYRPMVILRDGSWPLQDMTVLVTLAILLSFAAGTIFARRDLSTV